MMLKVIILMLSTISITTAQVTCGSPLEVGELRVKKSKKCVNIHGTDGRGDVDTYWCDGYDDQQIIMCSDGTIRNSASPNYCISPGEKGTGNVAARVCQFIPSIPKYQKWRYGREKSFIDFGGIRQVARELVNVQSGLCMNVAGYEGTGDINMYKCEDLDDQYYYFRLKGKAIANGRLQVQKSGLCLDVNSGSVPKMGNDVRIYSCLDSANQYFTYYENGELVNTKSRMCINVEGYDGSGDVDMFACDDRRDQMWKRPYQLCNGDYCAFRNRQSEKCLDFSGDDAKKGKSVLVSKCDGAADQLFNWLTEQWVTPDSEWVLVGCNQNGEVQHTISNTYDYSTEITTAVEVSVSSAIEAGCDFAKTSLTTTATTSLSNTWTESRSNSQAITFKCEYYDDGTAFTGGCMWRLKVTTQKTTDNNKLSWSSQIIKCSKSYVEPKCPPFTKCKDQECTMCE